MEMRYEFRRKVIRTAGIGRFHRRGRFLTAAFVTVSRVVVVVAVIAHFPPTFFPTNSTRSLPLRVLQSQFFG